MCLRKLAAARKWGVGLFTGDSNPTGFPNVRVRFELVPSDRCRWIEQRLHRIYFETHPTKGSLLNLHRYPFLQSSTRKRRLARAKMSENFPEYCDLEQAEQ